MRQITVKTVDRKTTFTREQVRAAILKANEIMGAAAYAIPDVVVKKRASKKTSPQ